MLNSDAILVWSTSIRVWNIALDDVDTCGNSLAYSIFCLGPVRQWLAFEDDGVRQKETC